MKTRAVAVLVLLFLSALFLSGCATSLTYSYYIAQDGSVHYDYVLLYDEDSEDAFLVKETAKAKVEEFISRNHLQDVASYNDSEPGKITFTLTYESVTDLYIRNGYTGKEENEAQEPSYSGWVTYMDSEADPYSAISERFRTDFLVDRVAYPDPPEMYYVYGTRYQSIRSNADHVDKKDGLYYHTWRIPEGGNAKIVIRNYGLNPFLLYGIAISVFVLSLVILFVIIYFTDKKNRKRISESFSSEYGGAEERFSREKGE